MSVFEMMDEYGHEQLAFCYDHFSGLRAIIAIHDTTLGPALGGTRMWNYRTEAAAIKDALRLSRSMTYQTAVADCDTGGGKAVLWGDPMADKNEAYFRAFGRFIAGLNGRFITYADLGTDERDMRYIRRETSHVAPFVRGGGGDGDGAHITAYGVFFGMKACCKALFGTGSLSGKKVLIQGVGEVGSHLATYLHREGAKIVISDITYDAMKRVLDRIPEAEILRPETVISYPCDIFSPCAFGSVITRGNVDSFRCKIIAGAAYDILESDDVAEILHERGILCAPDFVISAGELFQSADRLQPISLEESLKRAEKIYDLMLAVLDISKRERISPLRAARRMAVERIRKISEIKSILPQPPPLVW